MKKLDQWLEVRRISGWPATCRRMLIILICTACAGVATAEKRSMPESGGVETTQPLKEERTGKQEQGTPCQADSSLSEACGEPDNAWKHSAGDSPLRRFIKLFYGPDRPPGPDPDVDTNISAGGAGGG